MLILHRDNLLDTERNYKIIIDGQVYGKIKCGETKRIDIPTGKHIIYLKLDWCKSNKINFEILDDENIEFKCGSSLNGWRILLLFIYTTILKNKYLYIKKI